MKYLKKTHLIFWVIIIFIAFSGCSEEEIDGDNNLFNAMPDIISGDTSDDISDVPDDVLDVSSDTSDDISDVPSDASDDIPDVSDGIPDDTSDDIPDIPSDTSSDNILYRVNVFGYPGVYSPSGIYFPPGVYVTVNIIGSADLENSSAFLFCENEYEETFSDIKELLTFGDNDLELLLLEEGDYSCEVSVSNWSGLGGRFSFTTTIQ